MESKDENGKICVKESIKYICALITELGVTGLTPENLRLAKFNELPSPRCLLRALHDLVALYIACFPTSEKNSSTAASIASNSSSLSYEYTTTVSENPIPTRKVLGQKVISNSNEEVRDLGKKLSSVTIKKLGQKSVPPSHSNVTKHVNLPRNQEPTLEKSVVMKLSKEHVPEGIASSLGEVCNNSSDAEALAFVKFYLALWGYPAHSPFFTLTQETQESRHFLLALGWLISHCNVIERGLEHRLRPLYSERKVAPLPHFYPTDTCNSPRAVMKAREAECAAHNYVERLIAASDKLKDPEKQAETRGEQVLLLYGQVQATMNAIYAVQVCKAKKIYKLQAAQLAAGLEKPFTQYELHLLEHREKLELHFRALEAAKKIEDEKEACEKHEDLFWQWLESVAHEALADQMHPQTTRRPRCASTDVAGVTDSELLPVIKFMKQESATCGHTLEEEISTSEVDPDVAECERLHELPMELMASLARAFDKSASLTDFVPADGNSRPRHAEDSAHGLLMEPVYVYRPEKKNPGGDSSKLEKKGEEEDVQQSAMAKIKRLTEVSDTVLRVLAKTRAKNKTAILDILRPILEDDSYLFVGL